MVKYLFLPKLLVIKRTKLITLIAQAICDHGEQFKFRIISRGLYISLWCGYLQHGVPEYVFYMPSPRKISRPRFVHPYTKLFYHHSTITPNRHLIKTPYKTFTDKTVSLSKLYVYVSVCFDVTTIRHLSRLSAFLRTLKVRAAISMVHLSFTDCYMALVFSSYVHCCECYEVQTYNSSFDFC